MSREPSHSEVPALPSDRSFGLMFAALFALTQAVRLTRGKGLIPAAVVLGGVFLTLALACPRTLHPLNRAWMGLAKCLNTLVTPVFLGILYFGVLTPIGLFRKATGVDPLQARLDKSAASYWKKRVSPQLTREGLKRQF